MLSQHKKLYQIAQEDAIYHTWTSSFETCRDDFIRFADAQPENIRNFLYGYADGGRMAQQRLVILACENMMFPRK